jgi:hypothetical protein
MKKTFSLTLICIILFSVNSRGRGKNSDRAVTVNLRMRSSSNLKSKIITVIPEGSLVKLLSEKGKEIVISGVKGRWSQVKWKGKTGWVFGGYLAKISTDNNAPPFVEYDLSSLYDKKLSLKLEGNEGADGIDFYLKKNGNIYIECLLHGSGVSKISGTYSQVPDGTAMRFLINGTANILYIAEKEQRSSKKIQDATIAIVKKRGKFYITFDVPTCEKFKNREIIIIK